jgi:4-amino-4-deoxy-L-arabinose transferase-like glycosyltransferase
MHGCAGLTKSVSLVIPAFNEEAGIAAAIAEADEALACLTDDYEILIVDDGSRDNTFSAASAAANARPRARVLRHQSNRGYGAALRTGFEAARCELVAFTDADCQFDLADLGRLISLADRAPIIAGYRVDRKDPWRRRFMSSGYNLLARTLLGTRVRDCDCALKVFRREALSHLLPKSVNFFVNTEMLTRARQNGFDVVEVGVRHRPRLRGQSKVSLSDVPKTLASLLPFWWSNVAFRAPARINERRAGLIELALVLTVAALLFFCRLHTPLLEPEEGRYAEIPRQMLARGDWLVPTLNGSPYLDKPPMLYWAVMSSYSLFGVHDWSARLVPGFAGLLTVAIAWMWARRIAGRRAALLGAILLCLSPGFIYYGRMLTMNGLLALFVTATLATGHAAMFAARRRTALWLLAGVFCGLGLLTKGPVALALTQPPLFILMRVRWFRPASSAIARPTLTAWCVFLASAILVAAPWYGAIMMRYPEFAGYFFWFHNVVRFAQPFDHQGPPWEYIPGLLLGLLPWALLLVPLVRDFLRRGNAAQLSRPVALGFLLLTAAWALLFFSMAGSKRPVYLVPVFPPLALAFGCYLDGRLPRAGVADVWTALARCHSRVAYWSTAIVLVGGVGIAAVTLGEGMREPTRAVLMIMAAGLALAVLLTKLQSRRTSWLVTGAAAFAMLLGGLHDLLPEYARRFSLRHPVEIHAWQARDSGAPVACYPHRWDSVAFYTGRSDVSEFGRERRAELIQSFSLRRPTLLFVQTKFLSEILDDLPPELEFVARSHSDTVTLGEIRPRREAPMLLAQRQ